MSASNRIMKHTVLSSGLHDADIRPPALMSEFKRLSVRDAAVFFGAPDALEAVVCPACGEDAACPAFDKEGFAYVRCGACQSLYVNPRPRSALLDRYYAESEASRFRAAQFAESTASQRRYHQLHSNASWIGQVVEEMGAAAPLRYADVRTYVSAVFEEVAALGLFSDLYSIEPVVSLEKQCGVAVDSGGFDEAPALDVVSAFEKLEHQHTPQLFLEQLRECMKPGALLFLTTRTCSGFDLQILGEKAPYIYVPEHLNLMSIAGLEQLVQRSGFELIELSTPGQLDVELVLQTCASDSSVVLPPFVRTLLAERDQRAYRDFQDFLQKHRLSSHVRIAVRKPGGW